MITRIRKPDILQNLYERILDTVMETEADKAILSPKEKASLDQNLAASELEKNLVSHEEAIKTMSRWLKQNNLSK